MKKYIKCRNYGRSLIIDILTPEFNLLESPRISEQIMKALKKHNYPDTIFNLQEVEYIDSIGIGLFISIRNIFNEHRKEMALASLSDKVYDILTKINLERFFKLFRSMDEALQYHSEPHSKTGTAG